MKIQYSIFILLFLISCTAKTGKINQYAKDNNGVRQRNGIWEEKYASDIGELIGKGKYKKRTKSWTLGNQISRQSLSKRKIQKEYF